jgi:hypothetical protein
MILPAAVVCTSDGRRARRAAERENDEEVTMPKQDAGKGKRTTAAEAGADVAEQGAQRIEEQVSNMADMTGRVAQEASQRAGENLELMKRLAATMASGTQAAASEVADWSRQAAERQAEAMRRLTQARRMDEMLTIQDAYVHDNLQALLDFGAKISQLSAEKASEASGHIQKKKGR